MKRVFAFISLFAIALVMFGFATQNVKAADKEPAAGKWFENPHLLTDDEGNVVEIPMYIMNSITTTFPDFFDYEGAKGTEFEDKNWGGSIRQYAWNGVKVVIPQFDENGATGKYYGVYPQGASKGGQVGIGGMIYTTSGTWDKGVFYEGGSYIRKAPADPSLSFYLFNDQDTDYGMEGINKENNANPYTIFDGEGKAVAGIILPDTSVNAVETAYGLGTEFCWDENGVGVVANADASNCARVLVDGEEDDLDKPILDENGEPTGEYEKVKVPGEDPDYITYRFLWKYMGEKPANLNNGYLNEGWKADNWDFYNEETGVAVCIFSGAFNLGGTVNGAELTADESVSAGHIRAPFNEIVIPAGGLLYKVGYLERISTLLPLYKEVQAQAYLYGRDEDYSQYVKCYNYATRDIKFVDTALDGLGYSMIEGTNTIEAVAGAQIDFDKLINLDGVSYCFTDVNNPFSFQPAVLSEEQEKKLFDEKYAEFLAAAIEEIKVSEDYKEAYDEYDAWLKGQLDEQATLKEAIAKAEAELEAAKANLENIKDSAREEIKKTTDKVVKDEYQGKLDDITAAEKAIANQNKLIAELEEELSEAELLKEKYRVDIEGHTEFLAYQQALTHAVKVFKDTLKTVKSFVALELGNLDITVNDLKLTKSQYNISDPKLDSDDYTYIIVFAKAEYQAAYEAIVVAANETYEDDTKRNAAIDAKAAEFTALFKAEAGNVFEKVYLEKVAAFVKSVSNVAIANKAMADFVTASKKDYNDAVDKMAKIQEVIDSLKADLPVLEKALADAIAAEDEYVVKFIEGEKTYKDAYAAVEAKQAALDAENAKYATWEAAYKAEADRMNEILTILATPQAEQALADWKKNVYYNQMTLEYTVIVNGEMIVFKPEFRSKAEFLETFFAEFYAWCVENGKVAASVTLENFMHIDAEAKDYKGSYTGLAGADTFKPFLEANAERWAAAINIFEGFCATVNREIWASPWGTYSVMFKNYCQGTTHASYGPTTAEECAKFPFPVEYDEFVLSMSNNINEKVDVQVTVNNPILGKASSLDLEFVVCADKYDVTPIIEINEANLRVEDPKSFDIKSIANAYDRVYSEATGIKGNDISSQIDYICPELTAALKEGTCGRFPVEIKVRNFNTRKEVTKTTYVNIVDTIAPVLLARDVQLNYGEDFHYLDGIYFAYDNVLGNLFEYGRFLFNAEQNDVNTLKPGEYTVKVSVMDEAANETVVEYVVYVNEKEVDLAPIEDAIEDLQNAVKDTEDAISDKVTDAENNITTGQGGINDNIANVEDIAADNTLVVVATILAGVAAVAAIGAIVVSFLKK